MTRQQVQGPGQMEGCGDPEDLCNALGKDCECLVGAVLGELGCGMLSTGMGAPLVADTASRLALALSSSPPSPPFCGFQDDNYLSKCTSYRNWAWREMHSDKQSCPNRRGGLRLRELQLHRKMLSLSSEELGVHEQTPDEEKAIVAGIVEMADDLRMMRRKTGKMQRNMCKFVGTTCVMVRREAGQLRGITRTVVGKFFMASPHTTPCPVPTKTPSSRQSQDHQFGVVFRRREWEHT